MGDKSRNWLNWMHSGSHQAHKGLFVWSLRCREEIIILMRRGRPLRPICAHNGHGTQLFLLWGTISIRNWTKANCDGGFLKKYQGWQQSMVAGWRYTGVHAYIKHVQKGNAGTIYVERNRLMLYTDAGRAARACPRTVGYLWERVVYKYKLNCIGDVDSGLSTK